jgi:S-sulfosulfanyl-L-cysteine sulfohydrolase
VDQRPRHGRCLQIAGRGCDDGPLGIHAGHGTRQRNHRKRLCKGKIDFVAQNVKTNDFGDPVFKPYVIREINGMPCAIIGQAFPYTPIANPRYMVADWAFGIQDENMQKMVTEARGKGAQVVVVISHNGMDVDLKMASRASAASTPSWVVTRTMACPVAIDCLQQIRQDLVTNAGSNGKFLGVLDFEVKDKKVSDFRYKLLPVFSNMLPADKEMDALITKIRAPYESKLAEKLAVTDGLLYRRGNFNGTGDQLLVDALDGSAGRDIAFSPGFPLGHHALPGQAITREWLLDMTATTYSFCHADRDDGRDHQDCARRCGRQPVQPRPLLPARR